MSISKEVDVLEWGYNYPYIIVALTSYVLNIKVISES